MLHKLTPLLLILLSAAALSGCGSSPNYSAVTGSVTYLQRIALPQDAVITVRIEDISRADAPAEVIGEQVIQANGDQVPFPFEVAYDPAQIQENHSYSLRVRIEDGTGSLLYINDTSLPVITRGNPTQDIEVIVVPVTSTLL
jgi:putative lipoprotein